MKIKSINVWKQDLGNTRPYTIAFKTVDQVFSAFVEITLENGTTGIGSGNPSEYVTKESFESCYNFLTSGHADFLIGQDIRAFHGLLNQIYENTPANPAARAAIDIALHDAFAKFLNVPLVTLLGQKIESLPTSVTIGIKNVEETLKEAQEYWDMGFRVLKVKLGRDLEEDMERMRKLREVFKYNITIRVDANQGYDFDQTIQFFETMAPYDIEFVEQPMKASAIEEMKKLPAAYRAKTAADESCITVNDALKIVDGGRPTGIFNIKLMKTGGLYQAQKIADIARFSGVDLMWGCNDESAASITAALHVALSYPNTKYLDLDGSLDMNTDAVAGGFLIQDGWMRPNGQPGLGLEKITG